MFGLDDFLTQFLQPYFFYSLVFLSIAYACIAIFLKFNTFMSRRHQSIISFMPLLVPVFVLSMFPPEMSISASFPPQNLLLPSVASSANSVFWRVIPITFSILSITGLLCFGGITIGAGYLVVTVVFGKKIVMRHLDVCLMRPDEYVSLQKITKDIADKLRISEPKVGLIDDLVPNAFTVGYGRNVVIVFSLGLLNMLNLDELEAVVSHELSHVKSRDYLFRSISNSLAILSFFNPLAYVAASQAQRERELLADERGVALLKQPKVMANVLAKVQKAIDELPKVRFAGRLSTSMFLVSPLANRLRAGLLASHPLISHRICNINATASKPSKKRQHIVATALLLAMLVSTALLAGYATAQVQKTYFQREDRVYVYNALISNQSSNQSATYIFARQNNAYFITNNQSLPNFLSAQQLINVTMSKQSINP